MPNSMGRRFWFADAANVVPETTHTVPLAATNAVRVVYGFIWYYNAAAQVANRILRVALEDPGLTQPTGMTSGANTRPWLNAADTTLTTGEEATIYAMTGLGNGNGISSRVDNGTLAFDNLTTNPLPFPLLVPQDDAADLIFIATDFHADDRHSIYIMIEEWFEE